MLPGMLASNVNMTPIAMGQYKLPSFALINGAAFAGTPGQYGQGTLAGFVSYDAAF